MPAPAPHFWPPGLPRLARPPATTLCGNLDVAALRFPDRPATVFFDNTVSYARLKSEVDALAGYLQQRCGVGRGDRVALVGQSSPQFVIAYYAILRADAVVVPMNAMNTAAEMAHYRGDTDASLAICAGELHARVQAAGFAQSLVFDYADAIESPSALPWPLPEAVQQRHAIARRPGIHGWRDALAAGLVPAVATALPHDLCVLTYTSGTTGQPKGCMHTHATMMAALWAVTLWRRLTAETVFLSITPLFHMLGMQNGMNLPLLNGATVVILPRWDRDQAAHAIARHRVTAWTAPTAALVDFFAKPDLGEIDLSSLALVTGGGGPVPEGVAATLKHRFDIVVNEGYGMSETASLLLCNPPERPKMQCLGIPTFGVDVRIVEPDSLKPLPTGEVGEILLHGPQVMTGYWRNDEATRTAFVEIDGKRFLRSGDLGRFDADGYVFMTDRLKRMISVSGFKVWPAEVETLMYAHPGIQEACVIGVPDARQGETVKAFVRLKVEAVGTLDGEQIVAWLRERLSSYKVPRHLVFVDDFPRASTGKILWRELS